MPKLCDVCQRIHTSDLVVAVNRFSLTEPTKYRIRFDSLAPLRKTRAEAMGDVCNYYVHRDMGAAVFTDAYIRAEHIILHGENNG